MYLQYQSTTVEKYNIQYRWKYRYSEQQYTKYLAEAEETEAKV